MNQILILSFCLLSFLMIAQSDEIYDMDYAGFTKKPYNNNKDSFYIVQLKRKNMRVRAKYFASQLNGKTVGNRYLEWKENKNIICYSSGAYMSDFNAQNAKIVGLTLDYGEMVNKTLERGRLDALVSVFPNGAIDIVNLKEGIVSFQGSGENKSFDMGYDLENFIEWASNQKLTIFQTHLLAYKNKVLLNYNSSSVARERRFLVLADKNGKKEHFIIHKPDAVSLLNATNSVVGYLKDKNYYIDALINLDTGAQDVFKFYLYDGTVSDKLVGMTPLSNARNLIVYYFE